MKSLKLADFDPSSTGDFQDKAEALALSDRYQKQISELLYLMYAENKRSLLIILHGIDTSGKDGTVAKLFSEANPQGIMVHSFKAPSDEELRHDFLWRCHVKTPASGMTAIFNRSYYEEVSSVLVHPEYLARQHLPDELVKRKDFFKRRYGRINDFEKMLSQSGTVIVKFMLHISKDEQKERLEERLKDPSRNWKFSVDDIKERKFWNQYMKAYDKILKETHTPECPWVVIPADKKWYRDYLVSKHLVEVLSDLKMKFPKTSAKLSTKKIR
jgi:PPK2 family polyphosphate:nucleotide phosphotransferase